MKNSHIIATGFILGALTAGALFVNDAIRKDDTVSWRPGDTSGIIDPLYPPGRWMKATNHAQEMTDEPGYTDILVPHGYKTMTLVAYFENPDTVPVDIGMRTTDGGMDLRPAKFGHLEESFDLAKLRITDGRIQVIMSAPKIRDGAKGIVIKSIAVTYHK